MLYNLGRAGDFPRLPTKPTIVDSLFPPIHEATVFKLSTSAQVPVIGLGTCQDEAA